MYAFIPQSSMQGSGNDEGNAGDEPEQAPVSGRPRSASRANTPSLDTSDPSRKRGGRVIDLNVSSPCIGIIWWLDLGKCSKILGGKLSFLLGLCR